MNASVKVIKTKSKVGFGVVLVSKSSFNVVVHTSFCTAAVNGLPSTIHYSLCRAVLFCQGKLRRGGFG